MFEKLEPRVHLSASQSGTVITVTGAAGNFADTIEITQIVGTITVLQNGVAQNFASAGITQVVVNAGDGNDTVRLQTAALTNKLQVPGLINLGAGNDNFLGSIGADVINGDAGDDVLDGGGAGDTFNGGTGLDTVDYSKRLTGGVTVTMADNLANDGAAEGDNVKTDIERLLGTGGNDNITGNNLANYIVGNYGLDTLRGGAGVDTLVGSDNDDQLFGENDADFFFTQDSLKDTLDGGAGADTAQADGIDNKVSIGAAAFSILGPLFASGEPLPGTFDANFGDNPGLVTTGDFDTLIASSVAIQPDGKIVVIGSLFSEGTTDVLARYNPDGSLDSSFGSDGLIFFGAFGGDSTGADVAIDADGNIVVAATVGFGNAADFGVARYTQTGDLDEGFGGGAGWVRQDLFESADEATALAIQADGKIVVVGKTNLGTEEVAAVRFNTDGSLDTNTDVTPGDGGFNTDGKFTTNVIGPEETAVDVAIQDDQKILIGVQGFTGPGNFEVLRLTTTGDIDIPFGGGDGIASVDFFENDDTVSAIAVQPDGKIVLAGFTSQGVESDTDFAVARITDTGVLDNEFGDDGIGRVITDIDLGSEDGANSVVIQPDGKILVGGTTTGFSSMIAFAAFQGTGDFAVARYSSSGFLDESFGHDGIARADFGTEDQLVAIALQADGKIVAVGSTGMGVEETPEFALARFDGDGDFDPSFHELPGRVITDISFGGFDVIQDMAIQPDGKIVVVGDAGGDFGVARYFADGTLDFTFGFGGIVRHDFFETSDAATAVAIQLDGKIVVAGTVNNGGSDDFGLIRLEADGSPDGSFGSVSGETTFNFSGASQDRPTAIVIQHRIVGDDDVYDPRIIVVGSTGGDFAIAAVDNTGSLADDFGSGLAFLANDLGGFDTATAVALQTRDDGSQRILIGGTRNQAGNEDFAILAYTDTGFIDSTFSGDAIETTDFGSSNDNARDMVIQPDGKIILTGISGSGFLGYRTARYNEDGGLDTTFGGGTGSVFNLFGQTSAEANGVALQKDGKILVTGTVQVNDQVDFGVARYNSDGTLDDGGEDDSNPDDASFGNAGLAVVDFVNGSHDGPLAIAVQSDGQILVAGTTNANGDQDFALARLNGDPQAAEDDTLVDTEIEGIPAPVFNQAMAALQTSNPLPVALFIDAETGVMTILGTGGHDTISVSFNDGSDGGIAGTYRIEYNGFTDYRDAALISGIAINGANGNDVITIGDNVSIPATLHGGNGNDILTGGLANDEIFGDNDDDTLDGGADGNDLVHGGIGTDSANDDGGPADTFISIENITLLALPLGGPMASVIATTPTAPSAAAEASIVGNEYEVINTNDSGLGSLRAAILEANGHDGTDTITFSIDGAGPFSIVLESALPALTGAVIIDGTNRDDDAAEPRIGIDGNSIAADGLVIQGGESTIQNLVLYNFLDDAIVLSSDSNTVQGNYIGTDHAGTSALGNEGDGVFVTAGSSGNTIQSNLISGNLSDGIEISGAGATGNDVSGNFIGTDITGAVDLGNQFNGVFINAAGSNTVSGANLISGNNLNGVEISGAASSLNEVLGNFIGTDAAGTGFVDNGSDGVYIGGASNNLIDGNVISGNDSDGVEIVQLIERDEDGNIANVYDSTGNTVSNNNIGTDGSGTESVGNNLNGVRLNNVSDNDVTGNLMANNNGNGVRIFGGTGNSVTGNTITANNIDGVDVELNLDEGIGTQHLISQNLISGNLGVGIDLGADDAVTANDALDADEDANLLQNFPELASAATISGASKVQGTLHSTPDSTFTIEFFSSPNADGEGAVFVGSTVVNTDASGDASYTVTLTGVVDGGHYITATATDDSDNTSEFAAPVKVVTAPGSFNFSAATYGVAESEGAILITVNRTGGSEGIVTVDYATSDGSAGADSTGYIPASGTLTFEDGEMSKQFYVDFFSDDEVELNETFNLTLSDPTGFAALGAQSTATVTIGDDDAPTISVNDVTMTEGNAGTKIFTFTISLSAASGRTVSVNFATAPDSATTPGDYLHTTGTRTFLSGVTTQTVEVTVNGDNTVEPNEVFFLNLSGAVNGTILDSQGVGTITNDDAAGPTVGLEADPAGTAKPALVFRGTDAGEIVIFKVVSGNKVQVYVNGVAKLASPPTISSLSRLVAFGNGGNDILTTLVNDLPTIFDGGNGNDIVTGAGKGNVLLGGNGNDFLYGHTGKDLLIGGDGNDALLGGDGNDTLVAGTTAFDTSYAVLVAVAAGGNNFNATNVFDDNDSDILTGNNGTDRFFMKNSGSNKDTATDKKSNESLINTLLAPPP